MIESKEISQNEKVIKSLQDSLLLSESQACRMKECQSGFKGNSNSISCQIHQSRYELIKSLKESNPDTIKVHKLMNRIDSLQSSLLHYIVGNILDQKNILDENQKDKFFGMLLNQIKEDKKSCSMNHKQ